MTATQSEMLVSAMQALGGRRALSELSNWCSLRNVTMGDPNAVASANTVNDRNRFQGNRCGIREDYRSDQGHPKDRLYRRGTHQNTTYELYDPVQHGVWDRREVSPGKYLPFCLVEPEIVKALQEVDAEQQRLEVLTPKATDVDSRRKALRLIAQRDGRSAFSSALHRAYKSRCAITDCPVVEILEAAHIKPYLGPDSNHTNNGLLLRADIHTLFDKGLLWLTESRTVAISSRLAGSDYESLAGRQISLPDQPSAYPHLENLLDHRLFALELESRRQRESDDLGED
ncbi:HNH endonuclease [Pseudomonas sp. QL9]|uniref:HNH endonuclease n=1 Tax=Pseudomonas sp. QL9 TaxID=3242725 RepID=UPI003529FF1A